MATWYLIAISASKNYKTIIPMLARFLIRKLFLLMTLVITVAFESNNQKIVIGKENKVLIFSKTNGYHHKSIVVGIEAIKKLGEQNNFIADATEDSTFFTTGNLQQYKAIIFLSPTGNVLGDEQKRAFEDYIHKGGGFVGVHAATDCEYGWAWYAKMIGAQFESHPKQQQAKVIVVNKKHISTKMLPATWERFDEWYNYKNINPNIKVLLKLDETSYTGGKNGANHPIAWYQAFEGGRMFYTALGHTDESYSEPLFLQHLLGGIKYAMNKK
jgi:type 1 glutamine amidotransferase